MRAATARWVLCCALSAAAAHGCAHASSSSSPVKAPAGWVVVPHMWIVTQQGDFDCGPAALEMALRRWGSFPSPDAWRPRPGQEPGRGVTAGALRDEARRAGFRSYVFEGTFDDLAAEVGAGRPVVVGLVRLERGVRTPHFAVVVGHDPPGRRWLLADPALGVQDVAADALEVEWARSGWVTLVVIPNEPNETASKVQGA
jgi:predicted double-glycine peptidase